jgi:hypothetical protein
VALIEKYGTEKNKMKNISTIKAKFTRLRVSAECTKLFNEFDEQTRKIINEKIDYLRDEEAIFSFYYGIDYWWVVTNFRLIIVDRNTTFSIIFEDIKSIQLNEIFEKDVKKMECKNIEMILANEEEVELRVEENTWYAVYNIFKFLCN